MIAMDGRGEKEGEERKWKERRKNGSRDGNSPALGVVKAGEDFINVRGG